MQLSAGSETIFFKCYANLKCCSVKQLFNISEGESSLNCVVTSFHPAAAVSLLSKYSFPLLALMYEITTVFSNVCIAENSHYIGCVPSCHLSSLAANFQRGVSGEGETEASSQALCVVKFSCQKRRMGVLGWAAPSGMVGDPGSVPIAAGQAGEQLSWAERAWGQQGSQFQLQGLLCGTTDGGTDSSSLIPGRKCRP